MVMDVVATEDIAADREVFIDYGTEWEKAWFEHVRNYGSRCSKDEAAASAIFAMNQDKLNPAHFHWTSNHFSICQLVNVNGNPNFEDIYILAKGESRPNGAVHFEHEYRGITFDHEGFDLAVLEPLRSPCIFLETSKPDNTFLAAIFESPNTEGLTETIRKIRVGWLTTDEVDFLPKPWKSDMHSPRAFRHEIKIPDSVFPEHWMDLNNKNNHD